MRLAAVWTVRRDERVGVGSRDSVGGLKEEREKGGKKRVPFTVLELPGATSRLAVSTGARLGSRPVDVT